MRKQAMKIRKLNVDGKQTTKKGMATTKDQKQQQSDQQKEERIHGHEMTRTKTRQHQSHKHT